MKGLWFVGIFVAGAIILLVLGLVSNLRSLSFLLQKERINIVVYGENTKFYSLGNKDNLHYLIPFYPDLQIQIPGGYGRYRVGGLGKIVSLDNKPRLIRNAFSLATVTFVDYYFFPSKSSIYYGGKNSNSNKFPSIKDFLITNSNASLLERVYLYSFFFGKSSQLFNRLDESSLERYQGYFYQGQYRSEKKNIQIIFNKNQQTAVLLGNLLEGNGIRVADITFSSKVQKKCAILENNLSPSKTAQDLAVFFDCSLKTEKTGLYDILFILGDIEKEWEVK